jgi:hypothetical protein
MQSCLDRDSQTEEEPNFVSWALIILGAICVLFILSLLCARSRAHTRSLQLQAERGAEQAVSKDDETAREEDFAREKLRRAREEQSAQATQAEFVMTGMYMEGMNERPPVEAKDVEVQIPVAYVTPAVVIERPAPADGPQPTPTPSAPSAHLEAVVEDGLRNP